MRRGGKLCVSKAVVEPVGRENVKRGYKLCHSRWSRGGQPYISWSSPGLSRAAVVCTARRIWVEPRAREWRTAASIVDFG